MIDATPSGLAPGYRLYRRTTCLPRATFVHKVEILTDRKARLARLADRQHDPRTTVVLEDPGARLVSGAPTDPPAQVSITLHSDEVVKVSVHASADGYLRLADPYDAGWTAEVDGEQVKVYPADHYLRAVYLDAGQHEVVFRYNGIRVRSPQWVSLGAIFGIFFMLWFSRRKPAANTP